MRKLLVRKGGRHYSCTKRPRGRWRHVNTHTSGQKVLKCSACGHLYTTPPKVNYLYTSRAKRGKK